MEFVDAFPDFAYSEDYPDAAPSSDGVPRTNIHSLPVELLLDICQYAKFADIYSLTCVDRIFHAISIQRFYSLIPLNTGHIVLPGPDKVSEDAILEEIIPHLKCRHSSILRGLFARQEHLEALRTFIICGVPSWPPEKHRKMLNTLVHGILQRCKKIKSISITAPSTYHAYTLHQYLSFEGVATPESLSTLRLDAMSPLVSTFLPRLHSLSVLSIRDICRTSDLEYISPGLGAHIIDLKCSWHFDDEAQTWTCETFSKHLVTRLPNLRRLAIEYQVTDIDLGIWGAYMLPEIMDGYLCLAKNLSQLEDLTLLDFGHREYTLAKAGNMESELELVRQFSAARPSLRSLTFNNYVYAGPDGLVCQTVTWKKDIVEGEGANGTWTPDPTATSRWKVWFAAYGDAQEVRKMMFKLWSKGRDIPSIDRLTAWESTHLYPHANFGAVGVTYLSLEEMAAIQ